MNMSNNVTPLVSICSITYNHKPYIRQCLDSLLLQKTNFIYEIIINDDCSTDGTTEIIKEYASKYPNLIHPIFHDENQYSKGVRGMFAKFCFPQARGKYIAMCEGDDYWTDPLKLQKQVDFMETHVEYVMCSHIVDIYNENERVRKKWGVQQPQEYDIYTLVYGPWIFHPLSVLFRRESLAVEKCQKYRSSKYMTIFYNVLLNGRGYYMSECMAVYRQHNGGVWSNSSFYQNLVSNFKYSKDLYEIEKSDLAIAYIGETCIYPCGRRGIIKYMGIFIRVWYIYIRHYGLKKSFNMLYLYVSGKNFHPWKI